MLLCSVRDWLYGVHNSEPSRTRFVEPQTEAERLRVINNMITLPPEQGGAGITPNHGEWKNVADVFPLHDQATNRQWMRDWSKKTFLSTEDLDQIRNKFGESVSATRSFFTYDGKCASDIHTTYYRLAFTSHSYSLTSNSWSFRPCSAPFVGSSSGTILPYTP